MFNIYWVCGVREREELKIIFYFCFFGRMGKDNLGDYIEKFILVMLNLRFLVIYEYRCKVGS